MFPRPPCENLGCKLVVYFREDGGVRNVRGAAVKVSGEKLEKEKRQKDGAGS